MADKTGIEWTDASWNPIVGCSIVSPGCTNCYAMKQAYRIEKMSEGAGRKSHYAGTTRQSKAGAVWTGKVNLAPDHIITQPLRWKRPRKIFVNSMGDLFHEDVSDDWIDRIFAVMALCPQHTFQILTKRADRMRDYMKALGNIDGFKRLEICARDMGYTFMFEGLPLVPFPIPNVWLGVSVEDQKRADERIPSLLSTPAAVRFLSCEPLLGPVDLGKWLPGCNECQMTCGWRSGATDYPEEEKCNYCSKRYKSDSPEEFCAKCGKQDLSFICPKCDSDVVNSHPETECIDWIIVGGESGPGARPMNPDWARRLRDQCQAAHVPFFFKQWGEWHGELGSGNYRPPLEGNRAIHSFGDGYIGRKVGKKAAGRILDGRTWDEMPATDIDVGTKQEIS